MKQQQPVTTTAADLPVNLARLASPSYRAYGVVRRAADLVLGLVGLLVFAPLMVLVAVAVKLDSRGPVFYAQERVGRNRRRRQAPLTVDETVVRLDVRREDLSGEVFRMFKFRTMRIDAEAFSGPVWAQENDPRVTRVGRFLRRTRLDELPQLWNMVRGEMTLIGPRPERPKFVVEFLDQIEHYGHRHLITPGITGLSQVKQGYDRCLDDVRRKVEYDLTYIRQRGLRMDLAIMFETIAVMLGGRGAR